MSRSKRYVIIDWAYNRCLTDKTFKSFDDAWAYIYERFEHLDDDAAEVEYGEYSVVLETEVRS